MIISALISIVSFLIALSFHEFAHAWAADRLGDPNPKIAGRLTLNPIAHLDPIGSILLPLFLIMSRFPIVFGWAKPVGIDPFNLKNRRKDMGLISLAGPTTNLLLAILASLILRAFPLYSSSLSIFSSYFLISFISINVALAFFNLLPFHPLDGGKILVGFLPSRQAHQIDEFLNKYGQVILLFLIFPFGGQSMISGILSPIINLFLSLLLSDPTLV
jgi:Zn-dependent protease